MNDDQAEFLARYMMTSEETKKEKTKEIILFCTKVFELFDQEQIKYGTSITVLITSLAQITSICKIDKEEIMQAYFIMYDNMLKCKECEE